MDLKVAARTLTVKPIEPFLTLQTATTSFLFLHPLLHTMLPYVPQIVIHTNVMRDTVDNVNIIEVLQPLAGNARTLKTSSYTFLIRTEAKAMPAVNAGREGVIEEIPIIADVLNWYTTRMKHFL